MIQLDYSRCMMGGFDGFTPTNNATLVLYNNSTGAQKLLVWFAHMQLQNINTCGYGVFQGNPGGTVQPVTPLWTRAAPVAGTVAKLDTATNFQLSLYFRLGIATYAVLNPTLPWAILEPGWSFIIQDQKAGDIFGANVIWQASAMEPDKK